MNNARELSGLRMNDGVDELDTGNIGRAIKLLEQSCAMDPTYALPWLNLGLAWKKIRQWQEALASFLQSHTKLSGAESAEIYASIIWNIGMTATALGAWRHAAVSWKLLGHRVTISPDGVPSVPLGQAWVRRTGLAPALGERIDPARIRVIEDRAGETGIIRGEIVVHDAVKISLKTHGGKSLRVFPEL